MISGRRTRPAQQAAKTQSKMRMLASLLSTATIVISILNIGASLLGVERHAMLWNEQPLLGRWLCSKAAMFQLGDCLVRRVVFRAS